MALNNLQLVSDTTLNNGDKEKALDAAISQIERSFGKGSIMKLGSREKVDIETISTGSLSLDIALGIGGFPRGRVIEIYGPESSGKTTLSLHCVAEAQKAGGVCAFVDAEHALDPIYARKLGVDIDNLLISQPDTGEQSLEITDTLVRSGAVDVLVVDSVAALVPRAELEGDMGDSQPGLQARLEPIEHVKLGFGRQIGQFIQKQRTASRMQAGICKCFRVKPCCRAFDKRALGMGRAQMHHLGHF